MHHKKYFKKKIVIKLKLNKYINNSMSLLERISCLYHLHFSAMYRSRIGPASEGSVQDGHRIFRPRNKKYHQKYPETALK